MKILLLLVFFIELSVCASYGQNCAQTLRLASSAYDQGRLHELPGLLKKCLGDPNGFTKADRVTAYKLLTLSYIYLEEPQKADSSMIALLKADSFYEPNLAVDPAEFIGLYSTFRTWPLFKVGVKGAGIITQPSVLENNYVGGAAAGTGKYSFAPGFSAGFMFEKEAFRSFRSKFLKQITLAPEVLFSSRTFNYQSVVLLKDEGGAEANLDVVERHSWLDLNALIQYDLRPKSKWHPYISLGPGISYLISASRQNTTTRPTSGNTVSGADVDIKSSYNQLIYSVLGNVGVKRKLGGIYLIAEIRYQYGFINVVSQATRSNLENSLDYVSQFNDFTMNNFGVLLGVSKPFFRPQKLKAK